MSTQVQQNMDILKKWIAIVEAGNIDEMRRFLLEMSSDEYMLHNPYQPDFKPGKEYLMEWFDQWTSTRKDYHILLEDMFGMDDKVAYRLTLESTDVETQVRKKTLDIVISRFEDGKVVEEWEIPYFVT